MILTTGTAVENIADTLQVFNECKTSLYQRQIRFCIVPLMHCRDCFLGNGFGWKMPFPWFLRKMKCAIMKNGLLSENRPDTFVSSAMMDEHPASFHRDSSVTLPGK